MNESIATWWETTILKMYHVQQNVLYNNIRSVQLKLKALLIVTIIKLGTYARTVANKIS